MTRIFRVILPVNDIPRAQEFYGELLGVDGELVSPGRCYFDCGGTILACYDPAADGDDVAGGWRHHPNQYIYFAVPDLELVLERARHLGCSSLDRQIGRMPWGERLFYAKDPFGNPICFVDEETCFTGGEPAAANGRTQPDV